MIKTRVHILSKSKQTGGTNAVMSGNGAVNSGEVAAASYAANADNAKEAEHAKEAALAEVAKAAKISENLTNDSPVNKRFISKLSPDTAQELITFLKGLKLGNDYSINELGEAVLKAITSANYNALEQSGFGITQTKAGKYQLNISDLNVWRKAVFNEIEKRKLSYVGGNFVFSACGSKIKKVEDNGNVWRCYFYQDDGTTATTNLWDVDDQARCQIFNIKAGVYQGVANRNYWRKVVAKGDDYIDLSKTDCEQGSDVPLAGDTLVQFGNRTKTDRQNIIEILTTGDEAPAIAWYAGVNSYSLEGKSTSVISPKKVEFDTNLFRLITRSGARVPLITDRGAWLATEKYGYYDRVSDNGRLWLCIAQGKEVTSRPSDNNPDWQLQVDKGANGTSEKTYIRYSDDNGATFTKEKPFVEETPLFEKADDIVSTNKSKTKPVGVDIAKIPLAGFTTGAVYTLSLDYKFDEKAERAEVVIFSAKWENILHFTLDKSTDFSHSSFAFTLPDFAHDGNYFFARLDNIEAVTEGVDGSVLARNVRIEKGGVEYPNFIGRNLAKGTLDFSGVWNLSVSGVVTDEKYNGLSVLMQDGSWNQRGAVVSCKAGRVYTFSFFAKVDTEIPINCKWVLRNVEDEDYIVTGGLTSYGQFTTEWKRYSVTIKFLRDCPNAAFSVEKKDNGSKMWLCGYKVEYGDKATEYSPAPEDLQFGLTTGKYIGIASWNKPYPPLNPSAYTWSAFKGEDGKDAEIYRLKASKESAKVTADGLLICDAAYTIEHVQGTSVEVITSEGAAGNKPYVSAHTDKGVNVSVTAGANNTILYKLNGYFDLAARPDNIIVELYVKVNGSAKIVDTRVVPILMEAMSYTRMVRDMRENISANGRDISTIRQAANSVSVKVNNTEARLENGDFVVKSDTTKFVGADGQKKVLIKDGKVSAELIDAKQIVAEGIQGNTIDAKNATFNNVNVSGTLKGVSGTFRQLQCENYIPGEDPTTLMFDSEGKFLIRDGDLIMSSQSQRKPRLIPVNTWVMGTFGAKRRTTMVVKGTTADFYLNDVKASPYTQTLETKNTMDGVVYEVPCFCYDNSGHTIYEFPVDTIVFNIDSASTFRYELVMYDTQRCMVINANDKADNVYIYSNGVPVRWDGGEVAEVIKLPITMLTPKVPAEFTGAGLMVGAFRDNNWGNLKNIGGV